jgi:hypothetical protein
MAGHLDLNDQHLARFHRDLGQVLVRHISGIHRLFDFVSQRVFDKSGPVVLISLMGHGAARPIKVFSSLEIEAEKQYETFAF